MDNKRMIVGMLVATVFIVAWMRLQLYLQQKYPQAAATQPTTQSAVENPVSSTTQPAVASAAGSATPPTTVAAATTSPSGLSPIAASQPMPADLGSTQKGGDYAMGVALSARGAGLDSVVLPDFKQTVEKPDPYRFQEPYEIAKDSTHPLATRSVTVDGTTYPLLDTAWKLEESTRSTATYTLDLARDNKPALRLRKSFEVRPRVITGPDGKPQPDPSNGYETVLRMSFENLTAAPMTVKTSFNGPTTPPREVERGPDRQMLAGYLNTSVVVAEHHFVDEYTKDHATKDLIKNKDGLPMLWAGTGSVYFNAFVRPDPLRDVDPKDPKTYIPPEIIKVDTSVLNPEEEADKRDVMMVFETSDLTVAPQQAVTIPLRLFFGPKKRGIIDNTYFSSLPFGYNKTLIVTSGLCGWCTFDWLVDALVWLLQMFHYVVRDWGLAIICLVCMVRLILHPITKRSQVSMMKMGKLGPEMERLKKKYGDDKEGLSKAQMQFYKEQGATPFLGCLPMFLQMPIWIALWQALQTTFEFRHSPFLQIGRVHLTWISDLAKPDCLYHFASPIPLPFGWHLSCINLLPVLLAVVFWFQQKMTPKPPATSPEQEQQQKMMQWMSLLFPVFLYNGAAGLNLYILTSTTIGIIESKIIRDHIKQKEAAEKEGKVFVETRATRQSKRKGIENDDDVKKRGIMGWLAELQAKAESMRNTERKGK